MRVTRVPEPNGAEHVEPQLMPAGLLVTVPLPVPTLVAVSEKVEMEKVAVTVRLEFTIT